MSAKHLTKQKKRVPPAAWICLTLAVLLVGTGAVFAKYRMEMKKQAEMIAANFHISSDYLEAGTTPTYQLADRTPFEIRVYNYEKENVAQISQVPMKYTVTVSGGTVDQSAGSFEKNGQPQTDTLTITPTAENVTVTVTTTSPYEKTLSATFQFTAAAAPEMTLKRIADNGDYYLLTIYSNQKTGDMTLDWPETLIPDRTNEIMEGWNGTSGAITLAPYHTYELIFFNPDGVNCQISDFTLS